MFLATSILPGTLGIEWGMSREQCLSLLRETHKGQVKGEGSAIFLVKKDVPMIELLFDSQGRLANTNSVLCQSRHWFVDYDPKGVVSTWEEYLDYYQRIVMHNTEVLGPPDFSGDHTVEGFPERVDATIVTYWDHPGERILIGIDHLEQRMPIVVRLICQRTGQIKESVYPEEQREVSLRVTHIEPGALGLKWGDSREQCLAVFGDSLLRKAPSMICVSLALQGGASEVGLWFDEQEGLEHIEVTVIESQWFWHYSIDAVLAMHEEYRATYETLVELHSESLGPPDFSGDYTEEGFPGPKYAGQASELTYWNRPEGRMQIGIGQEDRETPVFVNLACYHV